MAPTSDSVSGLCALSSPSGSRARVTYVRSLAQLGLRDQEGSRYEAIPQV